MMESYLLRHSNTFHVFDALKKLSIASASLIVLSCKTTSSHVSEAREVTIPQIERFEPWLEQIERELGGATSLEDAATAMVKGPARVASYHLQALGRIYADQGQWFKNFRNEFRELENAIGEHDKWAGMLARKTSRMTREQEDRFRKKQAEALTALQSHLIESSWYGADPIRSDEIRFELANLQWTNAEDDRRVGCHEKD